MPRILNVAVAQMGPIDKGDSRERIVARIVELFKEAKALGADVVVLPELCLTTFFPRFSLDQAARDAYFEHEMPNISVAPIFEYARDNRLGFSLGFAEIPQNAPDKRFNTQIFVDDSGVIAFRYRKVHLPGYREHQPDAPFQHFELAYFDPGDLGFPVRRSMDANVGMCICNDRRWPETFRVLGLQNVEIVLCGYNTAGVNFHGSEPAHLRMFHHLLSVQAGAYQNSTFVAAAAKAGIENGVPLIAGSCIVAPSGEVVVLSQTQDDEIIFARCNLDHAQFGKRTMFDFAKYRRPDAYHMIVDRVGAEDPEQ